MISDVDHHQITVLALSGFCMLASLKDNREFFCMVIEGN
jgi:hypothetical protein